MEDVYYTVVYIFNITGLSDEVVLANDLGEEELLTILILPDKYIPQQLVESGELDSLLEKLPTGVELLYDMYILKAATYVPSNKEEKMLYLDHIRENLNDLLLNDDLVKVSKEQFSSIINDADDNDETEPEDELIFD